MQSCPAAMLNQRHFMPPPQKKRKKELKAVIPIPRTPGVSHNLYELVNRSVYHPFHGGPLFSQTQWW